MKAIILAAGRGSRLGGLTRDLPKALVPVAGRPLLQYTLNFLDHSSVTQTIVVGGCQFNRMKEFLHGRNGPNQTELIENKDFHLGSVVSLWQANQHLDDDVLVMNADHIYPASFLKKLFHAQGDIIVACDFDRKLGDDDMKIQELPKGFIKAISKKLTLFDGGYIGMTLIRRAALSDYRACLQETLEQNKNAVVEEILQRLIDRGKPPRIADLSGDRWYEIDTPEELLTATAALSE